jgi:hypothetical protein
VRPKSAIAEISTRVRGVDKNTGAPCDATASGVLRQLPDLFPVFYPDLKKEFSEVRSGSEIGRKSRFCPQALQPQAFPAEASQPMKQSTLRPKSAIAETSTRGTPHNHLTANLATTTTGSREAYLLDARLHQFIAFHGNKQ